MGKKLLVGSAYFFSCYPDFVPGDIDELEIIDTTEFGYLKICANVKKNTDLFRLKKQPNKETYIKNSLAVGVGKALGQYLVPEVCRELGFTVEDLPKVQRLVELLDKKHEYEKIIYEAYLENKDFSLTDSQRLTAYQCYKTARTEERK
jgi:hypothetical protein